MEALKAGLEQIPTGDETYGLVRLLKRMKDNDPTIIYLGAVADRFGNC